jgi:hypothetical protein
MIAEPKQVTEWHFAPDSCFDILRGHTFKVRAETPEQAARRLITELRDAIADLQKIKGQNKINQSPTA